MRYRWFESTRPEWDIDRDGKVQRESIKSIEERFIGRKRAFKPE